MRIDVLPDSFPFASRLRDVAEQAAERLGLEAWLDRVTVVVDDIAHDERVWVGPDAAAADEDGRGRAMRIWCHAGHFIRDRGAALAILPGDFPWEIRDPFAAAEGSDESLPPAFVPAKAERFVYHQFLMLRDLRDGTLAPAEVPAGMSWSFLECWAVVIDGRLRRDGLPGYPVADRRRRFYRTFARGGLVLPQHWQIFRELWDEEDWTQERLLAALASLPPTAAQGPGPNY